MQYEIALSFAGEDRAYVEMVARLLRTHHVTLFYDEYEQTDLWGKNLYEHLTDVYSKAQRFVVMFVSSYYAQKVWPRQERRAAQARALEQKDEYILPVRFDDTDIPGLLSTVSYLDARRLSPEQIGHRILEKLGRPVHLTKANHVPAPNSTALCNDVQFDFRSRDGRFEIGQGDLLFETKWSGAGDDSVHCYNDPPSIRGIALVPHDTKIGALNDVSILDYTSRSRKPHVGQFLAMQNVKGFYALLRINGVKDSARGAPLDQLRFRYWILPDGSADFSRCT
jgi:hypothetical protein